MREANRYNPQRLCTWSDIPQKVGGAIIAIDRRKFTWNRFIEDHTSSLSPKYSAAVTLFAAIRESLVPVSAAQPNIMRMPLHCHDYYCFGVIAHLSRFRDTKGKHLLCFYFVNSEETMEDSIVYCVSVKTLTWHAHLRFLSKKTKRKYDSWVLLNFLIRTLLTKFLNSIKGSFYTLTIYCTRPN